MYVVVVYVNILCLLLRFTLVLLREKRNLVACVILLTLSYCSVAKRRNDPMTTTKKLGNLRLVRTMRQNISMKRAHAMNSYSIRPRVKFSSHVTLVLNSPLLKLNEHVEQSSLPFILDYENNTIKPVITVVYHQTCGIHSSRHSRLLKWDCLWKSFNTFLHFDRRILW